MIAKIFKRDFFQIFHAATKKATAAPVTPSIIINKKIYANPIYLTRFFVLLKYYIPYACTINTNASTMIPAIKTSETLTGERSPLCQSENRPLLSSSILCRPFRFQSIK